MSLRAGYGISDAMLRNDKELYYNTPTTYKTTCISAGLGFQLGAVSLDLAYQYIKNEQTQYMLFYALDDTGYFDSASPTYKTDFERNYVTLTMGYKF